MFKIMLGDTRHNIVHEAAISQDEASKVLDAGVVTWRGRHFVFQYKVRGVMAYLFEETTVYAL